MALNATQSLSSQINAQNSNRLTGMFSGLDTETLIKKALSATQARYDKQFQAYQKLAWQRDAYRDLNNTMRTFREDWSTTLKQSQNMASAYNYKTNKIVMDSAGASSAVTITAGPDAQIGQFFSVQVEQLATGNAYVSSGAVDGNPLGSEITLSTSLSKIAELAGTGGASAYSDGAPISFTINGKAFSFSGSDTLGTVISRVNGSDAGVTMSYSQLTDKMTIASKTVGAAGQITIDSDASGFLAAFKIDGSSQQTGHMARVNINGTVVERDSNNFTLDGVTFKLNRAMSAEEIAQNKSVDFHIEQDVDKAMDNIKNYVAAYNKMIASLNDKINEKVNKNYPPLTQDQRSSLTDEQITKWEDLSKQGILRNDRSLQNLMSDLRGQFYSKVGSTGKTLADIGLTTTSDYTDGGQIVIDEVALRKRLTENPDEVFQMFAGRQYSDKLDVNGNPVLDMKGSGLVHRLNESLRLFLNDNEGNAQSVIESSMVRMDKTLSDLASAYKAESDRQYAKFAAMEDALAKLSSQTGYITQLLGGN